jgi:hypothetical protein
MRRIFLVLAIVILVAIATGALWIFGGPRISAYLDGHGIAVTASEKVTSVRYEGNGTGGVFHANQVLLLLDSVVLPAPSPSIGSTKDGKLAVAAAGKVFPLGPMPANGDDSSENLIAAPDKEDDATVTVGHSRLSWPTPFDFNFMTGVSPAWKRFAYQRLTWIKPNGSKLEMLWRYEQPYYGGTDGWGSPTMIHSGETGLVQVEITMPNR